MISETWGALAGVGVGCRCRVSVSGVGVGCVRYQVSTGLSVPDLALVDRLLPGLGERGAEQLVLEGGGRGLGRGRVCGGVDRDVRRGIDGIDGIHSIHAIHAIHDVRSTINDIRQDTHSGSWRGHGRKGIRTLPALTAHCCLRAAVWNCCLRSTVCGPLSAVHSYMRWCIASPRCR